MSDIFGGEEAGLGTFESAEFIVHPFPLEATVSYGSGTAAGPAAVLLASRELEFFDEESWQPYWDDGAVHTMEPLVFDGDLAAAARIIEEAVRQTVQAGKFPLSLGGEHSVTLGCVRAIRERYPDAGVLFVDAHLDLRDEYGGTRFSHACVARRIIDDEGAPMSWCGIRSVSQEEAEFLDDRELAPVYAAELEDDPDWIDRVIDPLPDDVYLSIDIDGLDPSIAPGTGTPEPGGLQYRELLRLIRQLAADRRIVGADIVEVAPIPGQQVTEFTAAKIAAKLIGSCLSD